jgi:hypothetical protein
MEKSKPRWNEVSFQQSSFAKPHSKKSFKRIAESNRGAPAAKDQC